MLRSSPPLKRIIRSSDISSVRCLKRASFSLLISCAVICLQCEHMGRPEVSHINTSVLKSVWTCWFYRWPPVPARMKNRHQLQWYGQWVYVSKASMDGISVLTFSCFFQFSPLDGDVCSHHLTTLCPQRMGFQSGWQRHWCDAVINNLFKV